MTADELRLASDLVQTLGVPVCVLLFCGCVLWRLMPQIRDLLTSAAEERRARIKSAGEYAEVVRHNSAVIENNTAALNLAVQAREADGKLIQSHEDMSRERMSKIQATADEVASSVDKLITDVQVIKERSK